MTQDDGRWFGLFEIMNAARGEILLTIRPLVSTAAEAVSSALERGRPANWAHYDAIDCRLIDCRPTLAAAKETLEYYLGSMRRTGWKILL